MTLSDFSKKIIKLGEDLPEIIDESFKVGLVNLRANMQRRIFEEKRDINGNALGQYSTKTTLIGAQSFRNKTQASKFFKAEKAARKRARKAAGQTGGEAPDSGWRTVGGNSLLLLPGGYKELRRMQGMNTSSIDLQYTGELKKSGMITKVGKNVYQVVFRNTLSKEKARGFEASHGGPGTVFAASAKEADTVIDDINYAFTERLKAYV